MFSSVLLSALLLSKRASAPVIFPVKRVQVMEPYFSVLLSALLQGKRALQPASFIFPATFVQAMEPFFSVLLSALFLGESASAPVLLTLLPIVGGVAAASVSEV